MEVEVNMKMILRRKQIDNYDTKSRIYWQGLWSGQSLRSNIGISDCVRYSSDSKKVIMFFF